ncbi:MAG TPA: zf-HC2 domain-containing protein [Jatrophihabitans sp.]|jgi:anti-sigma-K factor RskA
MIPSQADPHRYDDAAYVIGALSPDERLEFEAHLLTCRDCAARVSEIETLPALLADIDPAEVLDDEEPLPDTLLPALLRAAARRRRRQRITMGGLAGLAAACIITLVVALWPSSTSTSQQRDFVPVAQSPVQASATLTAKSWGTAIDVHCHYLAEVSRTWSYNLIAYDRRGTAHRLGDWRLPPDTDVNYQAGTSLTPAQISLLEITLPNGKTVLRLKT